MRTVITLTLASLAIAGCASPVAQSDPNCTLEVERTMEYGGGTFTKKECHAWTLGPTPAQAREWERRHPAKAN